VSAPFLILLVRSIALAAIAFGSAAWGDERASSIEPVTPAGRINPVMLLRQALASVVPAQEERMRLRAERDAGLSVDFASGNERDRVSLSLAESQVSVRLGEDLQLNCEVSSRDLVEAAPELGIDLAIQFKFR
jgi:hypothetical protein